MPTNPSSKKVSYPTVFITPQDVINAFYQALNQSEPKAILDIWTEDEDPVCIHPNGDHLKGLGEILDSWTQILNNGSVQIEAKTLATYNLGMNAVIIQLERCYMRLASETEMETVYCYATHVLQKSFMGWKLLVRHCSPSTAHTEFSESTLMQSRFLH